jgi:nucleotide-binding universal stress UspA family protein/CBS-domain-containing membrane protein
MFQHLLLALDGSDLSLTAADVAVDLAVRFSARLDILSVEEAAPRYVATSEESAREHEAARSYYQHLQDPIRQRAEHKGVQVQSAVVSGHEVQALLDYLNAHFCDLVLAGSQGHSGVWGAFLGSTVDKLVNHAPCSILVIREKMGKKLYQRLLVALDGSPLSWHAFQIGVQMATSPGASLHVVSVVEGPQVPLREQAVSAAPTNSGGSHWNWSAYLGQVQAQAIAQAALAGIHLETSMREGHASSVLVAVARELHNDLLLLGATGQEHPWSATTGGTARRVANEAPCAVLLVRPPTGKPRVRDLMAVKADDVVATTPLTDVMSRLVEQGIKLLSVVNDQQQVIGVITLGSLLAQDEVYRRLDLPQTPSTEDFLQHLRQLFTDAKVAGDVMIRRPIVVKADVEVEAAVRWMLAQQVTRMPVVDAEGKLVGLLDQEHLLRFSTSLTGPQDPSRAQRALAASESPTPNGTRSPRTVGEMTLTCVPLVAFDTPPIEVLRQIQGTPLHRVIVVDQHGAALGVIADRDLLAARGLMARRNPLLAFAGRFALHFPEDLFRRRFSSGLLSAQQVMRPHIFSVKPGTSVAEAIRLMIAHQIKRLVVVDDAGKPLGLVDRQQLLHALVEGGAAPG